MLIIFQGFDVYLLLVGVLIAVRVAAVSEVLQVQGGASAVLSPPWRQLRGK